MDQDKKGERNRKELHKRENIIIIDPNLTYHVFGIRKRKYLQHAYTYEYNYATHPMASR
jgi:hypothetical protein